MRSWMTESSSRLQDYNGLRVVDLLKQNRSLKEIREFMRDRISESPKQLSSGVQSWLCSKELKNNTSTVSEKRGISEIIEDLSKVTQWLLKWKNTPCRFTVTNELQGRFRVCETGSSSALIRTGKVDKLLHFNYETPSQQDPKSDEQWR